MKNKYSQQMNNQEKRIIHPNISFTSGKIKYNKYNNIY